MSTRILKAGRSNKGFTLIEVIVVLAILGVVLGLLIPRLVFRPGFFEDSNLDVLNKLVADACKRANATGYPQRIEGVLGDRVLRWKSRRVFMEDEVNEVKVNLSYIDGLEYSFSIYPGCFMDRVEMRLGKKKLVSNPLTLGFSYE